MGNLSFIDPNTPPGDDFEPAPKGRYLHEITDAEFLENKAGNGHNLKLTYKNLDLPGKTIREWLAVDNQSEKAQAIAQGKLSKLCKCSGLPGIPGEESKLLGRTLYLGLDVQPYSKDGEERLQNVITGYFPKEGVTPAAKAGGKASKKVVVEEKIIDEDPPF